VGEVLGELQDIAELFARVSTAAGAGVALELHPHMEAGSLEDPLCNTSSWVDPARLIGAQGRVGRLRSTSQLAQGKP
jgi:hypothetical protein